MFAKLLGNILVLLMGAALLLSACSSQKTVAPIADKKAEEVKPVADKEEVKELAPTVVEKTQIVKKSTDEKVVKKAVIKKQPKSKSVSVTKVVKTKTAKKAPSQKAAKKVQVKPKPATIAIKKKPAIKLEKTKSAKPVIKNTVKKTVPKKIQLVKTSMNGVVSVIGLNEKKFSAENTLINLKPLFNHKGKSNSNTNANINMLGKRYGPRFVTVQTNDTVSFKNLDSIKHNVFSSTENNTFDLGTYGLGKSEDVTLKNEGVVKVYCNIHPNMASFIMVSDHNYSAVADKKGRFTIKNLPLGQYQLTAWNIRGEYKAVVKVTKNSGSINIRVDAAQYKKIQHLNKEGKAYPVNNNLFEDEFY